MLGKKALPSKQFGFCLCFLPEFLGLELLEQSQSMLCQKWLKVEVVTLDR